LLIQSQSEFQNRIEGVSELPPIPAILLPLLTQLDECAGESDLHKIVQLVSHDSAIASQVIHMANSPLFGMRGKVSSLREASIALGVSRLRDIVTSCCLMQISPKASGFDVASFWEHCLACALISRSLARKLKYRDPERAYLAGLMHDLGIMVNMMIIPKEFARVFKTAAASRRPLRDVELELIGISHEVTGRILSSRWQLFDYLTEIMCCHHDVQKATLDPTLAAIVSIADMICRTSGLGYGYEESLQLTLQDELAWKILSPQCPSVQSLDVVGFTIETETYVKEVRNLISVLFRV